MSSGGAASSPVGARFGDVIAVAMAIRALLVVVGIAALTALLSLYNEQRKAQSAPLAVPETQLQMLRQRLASAETRAADAEAILQRERQQRSLSTGGDAPAATGGNSVPETTSQGEATTYVHTLTSLPAKPGDLMMTTYATGGVREMLQNWVLHVRRLGLPILVSAMDKDVVAQCSAQRFHCLDWSHTAAAADTSYVRGSFDGFRALGVRKLDALLPVLRAGIHVVLSDVDCVWSSSPLPLFHGSVPSFEDFRNADVLVATDCMTPELDSPHGENMVPGCFRDTVDKNTGVIAVRATPNGIATMAEWKIRLQVGEKDEQDQTTFNDLLDGNGRGHRWGMNPTSRARFRQFADGWCAASKKMRGYNELWEKSADGAQHHPGSRRIFTVCFPNVTRTALVGVFPIQEVAGGHTFFVQQLQSPTAKWPMAVHATYQFGDMPDYPFGKRQRFRDWGMWLADGEELVTSSRYLVLEDDAPLDAREPWRGVTDLHARGRQHVRHLERLRQRLAHGFALARVLNRTVVLPTFWCYCDKFWHRLDKCAIPSATTSQQLPFVCPLDHVIDPAFFHGTQKTRLARARRGVLASRVDGPWEDGLPFRGRYWLRQLGEHPRIGLSTATLGTLPARNETHAFATPSELLDATRTAMPAGPTAAATKHVFVPGSDGPHIRLPNGRTDAQLRSALAMYDHVQLLRVSLSEADSLFGCFEAATDAQAMLQLSRMLFVHEWCYRPFEMTPEWSAVERRGKPKHRDEPWCVWGFANPEVKPACSARSHNGL